MTSHEDTDDHAAPKDHKDGSFHVRDVPAIAKQMAWEYKSRHRIPMGMVFERAIRALIREEHEAIARSDGRVEHEIIAPGTVSAGDVHYIDGVQVPIVPINSVEDFDRLTQIAERLHARSDAIKPTQLNGFNCIIERSIGRPARKRRGSASDPVALLASDVARKG